MTAEGMVNVPAKDASTDQENPKDALGVKKSSLRLVPPALAIAVAPVMALGARKYGPYNWRGTPVKLTVYLEAMLRHIYAKMDGADNDVESGEDHLAHVGAGVGIVLDADATGNLIDDRPPAGSARRLLHQQDRTNAPYVPDDVPDIPHNIVPKSRTIASASPGSAPVTPIHAVPDIHVRVERHQTSIGLVYPHSHGPFGSFVWTTADKGVEAGVQKEVSTNG